MRVEISLGLLFPCALKGLPSGNQVRLDSTVLYLQPRFFANTRWQSKDVLQFVFPAGNHVALPVDLPPVRLPCVPT